MSTLTATPAQQAQIDAAKRDYDPALIDRLIAGAFEGDPAADALIAAFKKLPGGTGWRMLDQALALGPDSVAGAPPELEAMLRPLMEPPEWVDFDLLDAGATAYWRSGSINLQLVLTCGSLAYGYQSANLVRPLAATGRLEQMAPRRLGETARWVLAATEPGGMRLDGDGFRGSVRLRLVHALVRDHLLRSPDWSVEEFGVPISASDSMATATGGFFLVPLKAMEDIGVRFAPAELEAISHLWRWIGYVLGVPEDLLPKSHAEGQAMIDAAFALDPGPNEDSAKLMDALLFHSSGLAANLPSIVSRPIQQVIGHVFGGFTRRWMGDDMADQLGVPNTPLTHLAPFLRPANAMRNAALATGLFGSDERIAAIELAMVRRVLSAGKAPEHALQPEEAAGEPVLKVA